MFRSIQNVFGGQSTSSILSTLKTGAQNLQSNLSHLDHNEVRTTVIFGAINFLVKGVAADNAKDDGGTVFPYLLGTLVAVCCIVACCRKEMKRCAKAFPRNNYSSSTFTSSDDSDLEEREENEMTGVVTIKSVVEDDNESTLTTLTEHDESDDNGYKADVERNDYKADGRKKLGKKGNDRHAIGSSKSENKVKEKNSLEKLGEDKKTSGKRWLSKSFDSMWEPKSDDESDYDRDDKNKNNQADMKSQRDWMRNTK